MWCEVTGCGQCLDRKVDGEDDTIVRAGKLVNGRLGGNKSGDGDVEKDTVQ